MTGKAAPVRLAVFDFDGTLVDSLHAISSAVAMACGAHGLEAPPVEKIRRVIGLPLDQAIALLLPESHAALHEKLTRSYKEAFATLRAGGEHDEALYPGMRALLDDLAREGFILGIATGKSIKGLNLTLQRLELAQHFTTLQTPDFLPGKPHPAMLLEAMRETGAEKVDTVMIGDTIFDMGMAQAAGVAAIAVAWGYHGCDELEKSGARALVREAGEILPLIRSFVSNREE